MKRGALRAALLLLIVVPDLYADVAVYHAPRAGAAPAIDGKLDDEAWSAAPARAGFVELGKTEYVPCQTFLRVLWDEKNLYVGLKAMEPLMDKLVISGSGLWNDDGIEIFAALPHGYGQHAINTAGAQWAREKETQGWPGKVFKGENFYSIELTIPLAKLGIKPKEGAEVRINFDRNRRVLGPDGWVPSCWSPNKRGFHEPEHFGRILLVKESPKDWPDPFIACVDKDLRQFGRRREEMVRLCEVGIKMDLCKHKVEPVVRLIVEYNAKSKSDHLEDRIAARALIPKIKAQYGEVKYAVLTAELFE